MEVNLTIAEFKNTLKARNYAKRTIELYAWGLDCFKAYLLETGLRDLRQVSPQVLMEFKARIMRESLALESKAIKLRAVKRLFEHLAENHHLLINPAEGLVETSRINRKIGTVLTLEEMQKLLAQPNLSLRIQIRDRAVMELLYATAIRIDELVNLKVYDVDLKDELVYVRKGKARKQRVVPLGSKAVQYVTEYLTKIRSHYAKKNPRERALFLTVEGLALTGDTVRLFLKKYRKACHIQKSVTPHTFRRTCATHMLQQGADIRYIQELLGHSRLKTTQFYTKVRPVEVKETHNKTHPGITCESEKV